MATIHIERPHRLDRSQLNALGERLADKLSGKLGGDCQWRGDSLEYRQPGVTAQVSLGHDRVAITVELGMLMSAFKGAIESEINRVLDEQLCSAG